MTKWQHGEVELFCGDSREWLKSLESGTAHCCVTSPPYYGLRDYGCAGQIGLEQTPEAYIAELVALFREAKRVLRADGTLWLNLGDSYYNYRPGAGQALRKQTVSGNKQDLPDVCARRGNKLAGLKEKDLIGIPWRVAFALQADGWYLRQDIIWHKPNPMPESVTDRCTKAHEYVFMLSKSARYYYDQEAIKVPKKNPADDLRRICARQHEDNKSVPTAERQGLRPRADKQRGHSRRHAGFNERWDHMTYEEQCARGANRRDVWTIATKPYYGAHFAVMPEELVAPCILAGCPEGGLVIEPFCGSGTVPAVAQRFGRRARACDLNPAYIELAKKRIAAPQNSAPLFEKAPKPKQATISMEK